MCNINEEYFYEVMMNPQLDLEKSDQSRIRVYSIQGKTVL